MIGGSSANRAGRHTATGPSASPGCGPRSEPSGTRVTLAVTRPAPRFELVDDRPSALLERWVVVVLEQGHLTAVDASLCSFARDPFLALCRMAVPARGVDRLPFGVMDQHSEERLRR